MRNKEGDAAQPHLAATQCCTPALRVGLNYGDIVNGLSLGCGQFFRVVGVFRPDRHSLNNESRTFRAQMGRYVAGRDVPVDAAIGQANALGSLKGDLGVTATQVHQNAHGFAKRTTPHESNHGVWERTTDSMDDTVSSSM